MEISFQKGRGKPDTLSIRRLDGSVTWSRGQAGPAYHDVAHYAVETGLQFEKAFYGIIDQGFAIDDFVLPRHLRPDALKIANLPAEAMQAEYVVNQIQREPFDGTKEPDFLNVLRQMLTGNNTAYPEQLTEATLRDVR